MAAMSYAEYIQFVLAHTMTAVSMALLFGAGAACAVPVLRYRIRVLLLTPEWFAGTLSKILATRPSIPRLAVFIFLFNGSAIFLYMLTGLAPGLPAVVVFMAGLNVVAAGMLERQPLGADRPSGPLPVAVRVCALLTFMLELPCLWYAMALGWTATPSLLGALRGADLAPLRTRVLAYLLVILPALAVSAAVEAYAVNKAQS